MNVHTCGGMICAGYGQEIGYQYCERCRAFVYDDCEDRTFPTGTDEAANRRAWDEGELRSPEGET